MNIFILDYDLKECAQCHTNSHVCKQLVETAQILSSVYYYTNDDIDTLITDCNIYKLTHKNHPCCKWVRESLDNWLWLQELGIELYIEYQYRYGEKIHKSGEIILNMPTPNLISIGFTSPPLSMDEEYKLSDTVDSYRNYYNNAKQHLFTWKNREIPDWICANV